MIQKINKTMQKIGSIYKSTHCHGKKSMVSWFFRVKVRWLIKDEKAEEMSFMKYDLWSGSLSDDYPKRTVYHVQRFQQHLFAMDMLLFWTI